MPTIHYKGWTIRVYPVADGTLAELTDPQGRTYHEPRILVSTPEQASFYAKKCINWLSTAAARKGRPSAAKETVRPQEAVGKTG
ncbi:hypothetical protein [Gloeobacter morelensis]|uniref:Uncharacterized protein n=1 Tax=Gloeobacter morelensis MG652769 TaxID=2781736 RepID=A0ABY3PIB6_9CYAN|nr:hypothetical protein [Gloeobacter morelensis]UFP93282.1 hypothetical protein ISF26_15935 [Gloeobacter morelensis MG652769]